MGIRSYLQNKKEAVMPAQAGIQLIGKSLRNALDASVHWHDSFPTLVCGHE